MEQLQHCSNSKANCIKKTNYENDYKRDQNKTTVNAKSVKIFASEIVNKIQEKKNSY